MKGYYIKLTFEWLVSLCKLRRPRAVQVVCIVVPFIDRYKGVKPMFMPEGIAYCGWYFGSSFTFPRQ